MGLSKQQQLPSAQKLPAEIVRMIFEEQMLFAAWSDTDFLDPELRNLSLLNRSKNDSDDARDRLQAPFWDIYSKVWICQAYHEELAQIFFTFNEFSFSRPDALVDFATFAEKCGHAKYVRKIKIFIQFFVGEIDAFSERWAEFLIGLRAADGFEGSGLTPFFPNLRNLCIDFPLFNIRDPAAILYANGNSEQKDCFRRIETSLKRSVRVEEVKVYGLKGWASKHLEREMMGNAPISTRKLKAQLKEEWMMQEKEKGEWGWGLIWDGDSHVPDGNSNPSLSEDSAQASEGEDLPLEPWI